MPRGRPVKKPANRLQKSFLIEKGVRGAQLKKELSLGGRINVNDLDGGSWLNPTVVLRRLTVTIGGFRIELLPGPSYTQSIDASQAACFEDGISYGGDICLPVLPDDAVNVQKPVPEIESGLDVDKSSTDDAALVLGPYVNPNDVQNSNGALTGDSCTQEPKLDNQQDNPEMQNPVSKGKDASKQQQNIENNKIADSDKTDGKEKTQTVVRSLLKSPTKKKDVLTKPSNIVEEHHASKITQRGDLHKMKSLKERRNISPIKRCAENTQAEHATKVQKILGTEDVKMKSKSPSTPSSVVKKSPSSSNRVGDQQGSTKPTHSHNSSKAESHLVHSSPGHTSKMPEEGGQEKPKVKKTEKIPQRQKSRNSRSISVDEPQLFIPDNAPAVKKEMAENQAESSETVWDGNNCCGLCKQHHNNM